MGNLVDNKFTWVINKVSSLTSDLLFSNYFVIGGCSWRVVALSRDNNFKDSLSLTLIVTEDSAQKMGSGWSRYAKVSFTLINQISEMLSQRIETMFDQRSSVFRSGTMFSIGKLSDEYAGFMVDGEIKIVVEFLEIFDKLVVSKESNQPFKKTKLNDDGEVSKDLIREVPVIMESIVVNGFQVLPSQVEFVKRIFEKHPDIALEFRPKNPVVKTAYMNVLLSLIETLRQPPRDISKDDLAGAYGLLRSLKEAGFKLDWLETKLNEVLEKKEKEEAYETRMREIEEEMKDLKEKVLDVGAPLRVDDVF
ncbi:TRAF-like [Arabidopsis suecica]|uniref:TRAF-like n=1 Tax=Arabidopsis suecica TaxID=45249 RepID=A0A8T1ZVC1_ARASU|nr:TRAF-like [Arabidopsis suecica]